MTISGPDSNARLPRTHEALIGRLLRLERRGKRLLVLGIDATLCLVAIFVAFSLRVGALDFALGPMWTFAAVAIPLFIPFFIVSGAYAAIFRFSGIGTIKDLAFAVALYALPLIAIFMIGSVPGVPRTIAILHPIIFFGFVSTSRIVFRQLVSDLRKGTGATQRVVIYGAGAAGMQLALSLRHEPTMTVVAFVDDDIRLSGQRLEGLQVVSSAHVGELIARHRVDAVLLALPNISRKRRRDIVESLRPSHVRVQTLPQMQELVGGRVSVADLREIQLEDLLGRDPVPPNEILLGRTITGKTVMVTGAGGSIGSELVRQIAALRPQRIILVEMTEHALYQIDRELREQCARGAIGPLEVVAELLSLCDPAATGRLFARWRPQTVFHAAAYKHVPLVEANALIGLKNNITATRNAAEAARDNACERFVLISTDKAVRPTNVMGASKRVCELLLQAMAMESSATRFAMVRFGNVLGSSGSVVPRFREQIRAGGPVTLTHREVTRYFMTIPEAAQLVIQAGAMAEGGEVYLLDMGSPVRIQDLATTMIELSGLSIRDAQHPEGDIEIVEVGLRPGEKLYEELLIGDDRAATAHPQIFRSREHALTPAELAVLMDRLTKTLASGDQPGSLEVLREIVREYHPQGDLAEAASA